MLKPTCAIIIVLSGISIFSFSDPFAMNHGYSVLWFIVLYMIGACIKQFNWETRIKRKHAFFIYLLCVLVSWGVKIGGEWIAQMLGMPTPPTGLLISYISPTILLSAIALFLIFCNLDLSKPLGKFVSVFSPTAFSVYIIHCHECIGVHLIRKKYTFLADKNPILMIGCVIGFALAIFIICLLIDWVRMRIFGALKIKQHLIKVEDKIQSFFCSRMM